MCEFWDKFKLCTCSDGVDKSKPYWILEWLNSNLKDLELVNIGRFPPEYFFKIELILLELNHNNPFDFDYQPKQKDVLTLSFEDGNYSLIYTQGKWRDFYEYDGLIEDEKSFNQEGLIITP